MALCVSDNLCLCLRPRLNVTLPRLLWDKQCPPISLSVKGVEHAAWKRPQVVFISGNRTGIIKGFGWPYESVRCLWLVWQLTFAVDHCVKSVDVGSVRMSQAGGELWEPFWNSLFLRNLSADAKVSRNVGDNLFKAEKVGIQVFYYLLKFWATCL